MTRLLLDTSAYSMLLRGHEGVKVAVQRADRLYLNAVVLGEIRAGFAHGGRKERNESDLQQFLHSPRVEVLPLDEDTSVYYAAIYSDLRKEGTPIPANDMWIAATAMQHGLKIVTADRHFRTVRQVIVDWFDPM